MRITTINKNIRQISDVMIPVTSKSIAEPYQRIIFDSRHARSGEIMTFKEVQAYEQSKGVKQPLSRYMYYKIRKELEQEEFFSQLDPETAFSVERNRLGFVLEDLYEELEEKDIQSIENLSDEQIIEAISNAGRRVSELKRLKGSKYSDYSFADFLKEEFEDILGKEL